MVDFTGFYTEDEPQLKKLVLHLLRFFAFAEVGIHVEVYKQHDQSDAIGP